MAHKLATGEPPNYTLTAYPYASTTAWTCANCGGWRYAGSVHHCLSAPAFQTFPTYQPKPYKCPVCEGTGERSRAGLSATDATPEACKPCEGRVIVWG
jgi:hypothetical protein